ncbi:MAG: ChaN family lipoprotein, partial [Burkholderiales bacterium]|nr:ChaN family lipoprotein [Burkholderiales bacterium]
MADVLLLGEQHDAPEHQRLHLAAVQALVEFNELAALVLEMADAGQTTARLPPTASPQAVQQALAWRDSAWPWSDYGPAVMAAVAAGVPVLGGNLPRQRNAQVMREPEWDDRVPPTVLQRHRDDVRDGHCNLLPSGQIGPMTR